MGMPRLLGEHKGAQAATYRRVYRELAEQHGPPKARSFTARLMGIAALAYTEVEEASTALAKARHLHATGSGRRPGEVIINRLRRRLREATELWHRAHDAVVAACVTRAPKEPPEPAWKRKAREQAEQREAAAARLRALAKVGGGQQQAPRAALPSPQGQDWAISPDVPLSATRPTATTSPAPKAADAGGSAGARVTSAEAAGG
jgi:hypothetical protein